MEKKLAVRVHEVQAAHPEAKVELWSMDEQTLEDSLTLRYRVGLKPILRRVWVAQGDQPIAKVNWRFQWLWLYAASPP